MNEQANKLLDGRTKRNRKQAIDLEEAEEWMECRRVVYLQMTQWCIIISYLIMRGALF